MPYKDKEAQKEYQRIWARRKRAGVTTAFRTRPILSPEERIARKKQYDREYSKKRWKQVHGLFPSKCFFCDRKGTKLHRKDLENHGRNPQNYLKEPDKYVRLCSYCHKGVHFACEHLGFEWETLISYWNEVKMRY